MSGLEMKYFVLKPKGPGPYARASRIALDAYATAIRGDNSLLCDDLRQWVDRERDLARAAETGRDRAGRCGVDGGKGEQTT